MNEKTKKILLVVGFIAVSIGIAVALYYVFFRPEPVEEITVVEDDLAGELPTAETGEPTIFEPTYEAEGLRISDIADGGLTAVTSLTTSGISSPTLGINGDSMN